jgi:hypothetical protein
VLKETDSVKMVKVAAGAVVIFAACSAGAYAQTCTGAGKLSATQISSLLFGRWACGHSGTEKWNELHSGGQILDYKKGPSDPVDPSATPARPTGNYTITGNGEATGQINYIYATGGGSFSYQILANGTGSASFSAPGTYSFCSAGGAQNFLTTVNTSGAAGC